MEIDIEVGMNKELYSPYIIKYEERFEDDGRTFVVMEYMENGIIIFFFLFFFKHNTLLNKFTRLSSRIY
jgi:serine/threonine protein kinase